MNKNSLTLITSLKKDHLIKEDIVPLHVIGECDGVFFFKDDNMEDKYVKVILENSYVELNNYSDINTSTTAAIESRVRVDILKYIVNIIKRDGIEVYLNKLHKKNIWYKLGFRKKISINKKFKSNLLDVIDKFGCNMNNVAILASDRIISTFKSYGIGEPVFHDKSQPGVVNVKKSNINLYGTIIPVFSSPFLRNEDMIIFNKTQHDRNGYHIFLNDTIRISNDKPLLSFCYNAFNINGDDDLACYIKIKNI